MRAICGAIIAAGAMIGLGLTALGFGSRYGQFHYKNDLGEYIRIPLAEMDKPLVFILVFLTCAAIIGIGVAFVGLAYHHHRRQHEMGLHANGRTAAHAGLSR